MRTAVRVTHTPSLPIFILRGGLSPISPSPLIANRAWFKKCHFQVTPEIDKALMVKGFLVLGVTLI